MTPGSVEFAANAKGFCGTTATPGSTLGRDQADPHVLREVDTGAVGKHAAIGDAQHQAAAPDLADVDLLADQPDVARDVPPEFDLADPERTAFAW